MGTSSLVNVHQLICDATITYDTSNNQRVITIVYDGTNCWGNRTRSGKVIISLPLGQHWKDAGATANIVIDELKITRLRDNKSIVINGNKTYHECQRRTFKRPGNPSNNYSYNYGNYVD